MRDRYNSLRMRLRYMDKALVCLAVAIIAVISLTGALLYGTCVVMEGDEDSVDPQWEFTLDDGREYQVICYEKHRWEGCSDSHRWDMKVYDPVSDTAYWVTYNPQAVAMIRPL